MGRCSNLRTTREPYFGWRQASHSRSSHHYREQGDQVASSETQGSSQPKDGGMGPGRNSEQVEDQISSRTRSRTASRADGQLASPSGAADSQSQGRLVAVQRSIPTAKSEAAPRGEGGSAEVPQNVQKRL